MSTPVEVTPEIANQVLFHFNAGGYEAGSFTKALYDLIGRADVVNKYKLSLGFPAHVAAVQIGQGPGGIEALEAIAAGKWARPESSMSPDRITGDREPVKRDPLGIIYDRSWEDSDGVVYYWRERAKGTAGGSASWSSEHDCNPICGCHLSAKCEGCGVCTSCDGCYCNEWRYE